MYNNYPQTNVYESQTIVPFTEPIYSNEYEPIQYAQNFPMNQSSQSIYGNAPSQAPIYSVPTQQQYSPYPQYADNAYMNQQPQPPSYASATQPSPSYSTAIQQQQPFQNDNKSQAAPFTQDYKWPRKSIGLTCPKCGAAVKTRVETMPTIVTFLIAILLFLVTFILSCVPFFIRACKKSTHYCPHCNSILGVRREFR